MVGVGNRWERWWDTQAHLQASLIGPDDTLLPNTYSDTTGDPVHA
jgi:hypothetical protein